MSGLDARNVVHLVPMFRYAILLIIGVTLSDAYSGAINEVGWLVALAFFIFAAFIFNKRSDIASSVMIFCGVIAVGGFRMSYSNIGKYSTDETNRRLELNMCVISEPIERGKVAHFDGIVYRAPSDRGLEGTKVRVSMLRDTITGKYRTVHIGDGIEGEMDVSSLRDWHRQNSHFDYVRWLHTRGFYSRVFVPIGTWNKTDVGCSDIGIEESVRLWAMKLRQNILDRMKSCGMDEESFSIASAMTLGNKSALSPALRDEYSISGVSHILALSGVHLSIIYMILIRLFGKKIFGRLMTLLLIWGYVVFTGMPISVVRAACMLTLVHVLDMSGINQKRLNILGATAFIMIMFNPQCLWDVGFQMSFMAVLSIIVLMEPLREIMPYELRYRNNKEKNKMTRLHRVVVWSLRSIWFAVAISVSAQLGAMPLTAYYFGRIPILFVFANLIAVLFVPFIIYLTMAMSLVIVFDLVVGIGSGMVVYGIGWLLSWLVWVMNSMFRCIAKVPGASIGNVDINGVQLVAMYVVVVVVFVWANRKRLKGVF